MAVNIKKGINKLNIKLNAEQLTYLEENFFLNLGITEINEDTVALLYDEVVAMCDYYKAINAEPLRQFATELADILYDYVPWEKICANVEADNSDDDIEAVENDCGY